MSRLDNYRQRQIRQNKLLHQSSSAAFKEFLKGNPEARASLPFGPIPEKVKSNVTVAVNPITGQVQKHYESMHIPLKGDRIDKDKAPPVLYGEEDKKLMEQLENLRDVHVGYTSERQIQKQQAKQLRKTDGHTLAELLKNMQ